MDRVSIINHFIARNNYQSYLEIGVREGHTFRQVNCTHKVSVDPAYEPTYKLTSDEYFAAYPQHRYDLVFIDGLHLADQFVKDVYNSLAALNTGGTIVCHDILPHAKEWAGPTQLETRWCGTTWAGWARLRATESNIQQCAVDTDYGIGIIVPGHQQLYTGPNMIRWEDYIVNKDLTHLITEAEFDQLYG